MNEQLDLTALLRAFLASTLGCHHPTLLYLDGPCCALIIRRATAPIHPANPHESARIHIFQEAR